MVECFLVSQMQALHQLEAADNSADGKLTLNEMISNPYVFYGSSGASTCTKWKYMHSTVHETNDILFNLCVLFVGRPMRQQTCRGRCAIRSVILHCCS